MNYALGKLGLPAATYEAVCPTIGLSLREALVALGGAEHEVRHQEFFRFFVERADIVMAPSCQFLDGVADCLRGLSGSGYRLGIVSTKNRYRIEMVLEREGLTECFSTIVGAEDVNEYKPDPQGLQMAMERLAIARDELLYVGDSQVDAETAKRARVPFVAVTSGVTPKAAFDQHPKHAVLDSVAELPGWLSARAGGRA
jgi:phosphoglycolate phosphatase